LFGKVPTFIVLVKIKFEVIVGVELQQDACTEKEKEQILTEIMRPTASAASKTKIHVAHAISVIEGKKRY